MRIVRRQIFDDISDPRLYLKQYRDWSGCSEGASPDGRVTFPPVHSFIHGPEDTLRALDQLVVHALDGSGPLVLDRTSCTRVDGCAETVTAALASQAEKAGVRVEWTAPVEAAVSDRCGCLSGAPNRPTSVSGVLQRVLTTHKERVGALMVTSKFLDDQVRTDRWALDGEFLKECGSLFLGEAVDNSLTHGAGDCWFSGIVSRNAAGTSHIELVIFNMGSSIDQTILGMPWKNPVREQLRRLIKTHERAGYFGPSWTPETLLVRHALQQRITSARNMKGGIGSHGMIEFYEQLAHTAPDSAPECVVVTGNTYVRLSPSFRLEDSRRRGRQPPIQDVAFNVENDLRLPADTACIRALPRRLPGTIVILQFTVTPDHLVKQETQR